MPDGAFVAELSFFQLDLAENHRDLLFFSIFASPSLQDSSPVSNFDVVSQSVRLLNRNHFSEGTVLGSPPRSLSSPVMFRRIISLLRVVRTKTAYFFFRSHLFLEQGFSTSLFRATYKEEVFVSVRWARIGLFFPPFE